MKLARVFSSGFQDAGGQVTGTASAMLRFLALYAIANSAKLVLSGALRAAGDTAWVMRVAIALHWTMALAAILLARVAHAHPYVTWSTMILMNNAHAASVYYRFRTGRWRAMALIG